MKNPEFNRICCVQMLKVYVFTKPHIWISMWGDFFAYINGNHNHYSRHKTNIFKLIELKRWDKVSFSVIVSLNINPNPSYNFLNTFWYFIKSFFRRKKNRALLLLTRMLCTSCLTSCQRLLGKSQTCLDF